MRRNASKQVIVPLAKTGTINSDLNEYLDKGEDFLNRTIQTKSSHSRENLSRKTPTSTDYAHKDIQLSVNLRKSGIQDSTGLLRESTINRSQEKIILMPKIATISSTNLDGKGVNFITEVEPQRYSPLCISKHSKQSRQQHLSVRDSI